MSEPHEPPAERWSFSLRRLLVTLALMGVALACGRALAMLFVGADTAYLAAILLLGMVSAGSTAIGVLAGRTRRWGVVGLVLAIPLALVLAFLFQMAEV